LQRDNFAVSVIVVTLIMSAKETLLDIAEKLPSDATLVDAIYELEFRQAVEEGLASLDRGERIPLEEARKRIPQWISKYSSPTTR
jgi:predicted transcriptional regulator